MATPAYPGLNWQPADGYQIAVLGTADDGAMFTLCKMASCYRRGPYRLMVSVNPGPHHHDWGCFDDADQPMRWYHHQAHALAEAEAIARVLWYDRHRFATAGTAE